MRILIDHRKCGPGQIEIIKSGFREIITLCKGCIEIEYHPGKGPIDMAAVSPLRLRDDIKEHFESCPLCSAAIETGKDALKRLDEGGGGYLKEI